MSRLTKMALLLPALLLLLLTSMAQAATISGTITNSSGKSGRIYVTATPQGQSYSAYGVSLANAGSFTIQGVPTGTTYTVKAFMDTQGDWRQHANDPVGTIDGITAGATNANITLTNPDLMPPAAGGIIVLQGNGGNAVLWEEMRDENTDLSIADYYEVSWSSSASGTYPTTRTVKSKSDLGFFVHSGGASTLYYRVTAKVGANSASTAWTPVTTRTGGVTVSGTVKTLGFTPTGPLMVVLERSADDAPDFFVSVIPSPGTTNNYSLSNIPAGTYNLYTYVDMDNDGALSFGDISYEASEFTAPQVTVGATAVTAQELTIVGRPADAFVTTQHGKSTNNEWINIGLTVEAQLKKPVNVLVSGPSLAEPVNVGLADDGEFNLYPWQLAANPQVGDQYSFTLEYSDGTTTGATPVTYQITNILNSFPTPVSPEGYVAYNPTPTFSWTTPATPPEAPYSYSFWMYGGDLYWGSEDDYPSSQTSVVYNADGLASSPTLSADTTYSWTLQVRDRFGNSASYSTEFFMTTAPMVTGFTPASALSGSTITISGLNFNATPANNLVYFSGGVSRAASGGTTTSLTVTVPQEAQYGSIQVHNGTTLSAPSTMMFGPYAPVSFTGAVNVPGAQIELEGNPAVKTTAGMDGSFTLTGLPGSPMAFRLKISKDGYLPVYSDVFTTNTNIDASAYPYQLQTSANLNLAPGASAVFATILDNTGAPLPGVVAGSTSGTVMYYNSSSGDFSGTATDASGLVAILNLYGSVTITPLKDGWIIPEKNITNIPNSSVVELAIFGQVAVVDHTLTVTLDGSGSGSVFSTPAGIDCAADSCDALFESGSSVTLTATPNSSSTFGSWSGCTSATGASCSVTMDSSKGVTATFNSAKAQIGSTGYATLAAAYAAAGSGAQILLLDGDLTESLTTAESKAVTLKGGYNAAFSALTGYFSNLTAPLIIQNGTLTLDQIVVK